MITVVRVDDRGVEYLENFPEHGARLPGVGWAWCPSCKRAWNDAKSTAVTPTPAGRCPFEADHEDA